MASSSSAAAALSTTAEVHAIAHSQQTRRNQNRNRPQTPPHRDEPECPNCGCLGHTAGDSCPARGRTCHKCGKKNHFSRTCQSTSSTFRTNSTRVEQEQNPPRKGRAHHVADVREDPTTIQRLRNCLDGGRAEDYSVTQSKPPNQQLYRDLRQNRLRSVIQHTGKELTRHFAARA